jgi:hypothetical protein
VVKTSTNWIGKACANLTKKMPFRFNIIGWGQNCSSPKHHSGSQQTVCLVPFLGVPHFGPSRPTEHILGEPLGEHVQGARLQDLVEEEDEDEDEEEEEWAHNLHVLAPSFSCPPPPTPHPVSPGHSNLKPPPENSKPSPSAAASSATTSAADNLHPKAPALSAAIFALRAPGMGITPLQMTKLIAT